MSNGQSTASFSGSRLALYSLAILIAVAALGYYAYVSRTSAPPPVDELEALRGFIINIPRTQQLADAYRDADGDLVADPPADAPKVDALGFCLVAGDDAKKTVSDWQDFINALEKATGKTVIYVDVKTDEAQLAALRDGTLHVTAFSTGEVETAVNTAGFVPLACPADADGKYSYEMEILTPADSSAKTPAELKGKTIAFTSLSSNSGAKAPLVILKEEFALLPGRDYKYVWTGSHEWSIQDLARGKHDAVCVANDLLARAVAEGAIKAEQYKSVYKSKPFPPLCLGIAHDLPAEIAEKIKQALDAFRIPGTSLEKRYGRQGIVRFAPVDYKRDWAFVRAIDDSLSRLLQPRGGNAITK